jgi:cytochrome P450
MSETAAPAGTAGPHLLAAAYLADDTLKRCPYDLLSQLRDVAPVVRTAGGPWLVLDYQAAQSVLRNPAFSRSRAAADTLPTFIDPGPAADIWMSKMVSTDGERHRRLRSLVNKGFTPRAVEKWRPVVQSHANEILWTTHGRRRMEAVAEYAYPLPERVICTLLGVPASDSTRFEAWTAAIQNRVVTGRGAESARAAASQAILDFAAYLTALVAAHEPSTDGDVLSQLAFAEEEEGSRLSQRELVSVAMELIIGGHDTTANLITIGIYELASRPGLFSSFARGEFSVSDLVEELVRALSPVQLSLSRVATQNVEVAGHVIEAGDVVLVSLAAANRDPAAFPSAETFDPSTPAPHHIGFGVGAHYCLGANLARLEAQVALKAVLERLAGLHLTVSDSELTWREGSLVVAPTSLPVAW